MNLNPLNKTVTLRSRLLRYLVLPALVTGFAIPAADARPGRDGGYRGGSHASHGSHYPSHSYRAPQVRHDRHYHAPRYRQAYHAPRYAYHASRYVNHAPYYRPVRYQPRYVSVLPRGYRTVYRGGMMYYYVDGCYYRPHYHNNSHMFLQIRF